MTPHSGQRLNRVYAAIADPTRRAILANLAQGRVNVGELATRFPISLNGVSKHIKVLERAGLVRREILGRVHQLQLRAEPLREAEEWFHHYRAFWSARLDALELLLQEKAPSRKVSDRAQRTRLKDRTRE
jgi:DNA-binding transcriptional ArsR family regulator